ncbi:hypothetical protein KFK09_014173 [Dendrobium nobile]|uniref:CCHC-type domain-containing protein n=1 Tax=Dendrobium nobile TaxID=94219 RepID=A0A8T3BEX8_DENNO|nr:hypothetical protein KFK09_014173 [Dendrobium nobile]
MAEEKEVKISGLHLRGTEDEPLFENRVAKSHLPRALTSKNAIDLVRSSQEWEQSHRRCSALEALRSMYFGLVQALDIERCGLRLCAGEEATEEIFSFSFAAAMYLKLNNFPHDKKVYVIGEEGILEELELADGKKTIQLRPNSLFEHDKNTKSSSSRTMGTDYEPGYSAAPGKVKVILYRLLRLAVGAKGESLCGISAILRGCLWGVDVGQGKEIWDSLYITYEGKEFSNFEIVNKILRCLLDKFDAKVVVICESKNLNEYSIDNLIGSLIAYEECLGQRLLDAGETIMLKAEDMEKSGLVGEKSDDLTSKLKSPLKHKNKHQQKWNKGKNGKNVQISSNIICFGCKKFGHLKSQCPNLRTLPTKEKGKAKQIIKWKNNEKQKISWADLASESSDQEKNDV